VIFTIFAADGTPLESTMNSMSDAIMDGEQALI
jgi:hypothetical protein